MKNFIVSARFVQEEQGSGITVMAYENIELAPSLHSSDKAAINREKLVNLSYGLNS